MSAESKTAKNNGDSPDLAAPARFNLAPAGWVLAAVSLLAGLEAFGLFRRGWLHLWPGLLLLAGLVGAVLLYRHTRGRFLDDMAHSFQAALAVLAIMGGLGETLRAAGVLPELVSFTWPAALLALSYLLIAPSLRSGPSASQTPPEARANWEAQARIGAVLMLAGLLRAFEALFGIQPGAIGTGWFIFSLVAALLMLRQRPLTTAR